MDAETVEGVGVGAIAAIPTWGEGLSLEHEAITSARAARGKVCLVKLGYCGRLIYPGGVPGLCVVYPPAPLFGIP